MLRSPLRREVPIQVEALERRGHLDRDAVVILDAALDEQPVERSVVGAVDRIAAHEELLLLGMQPPSAVRIFDAHVEHSPVAVEILDLEAVLGLVERVWPNARADETPLL